MLEIVEYFDYKFATWEYHSIHSDWAETLPKAKKMASKMRQKDKNRMAIFDKKSRGVWYQRRKGAKWIYAGE